MKSKRIQELDDTLRERARERTRQQQSQKAGVKSEPKQKKQKPSLKTPNPAATGKRSTPKDYEPPDRPRSSLNARRTFLSKINEIAPEKIKALFDSCFEPFLKLTRYRASWQTPDSKPMTEAEDFPIAWLPMDEAGLRITNPDFEGLSELQERVAVKRDFCERLIVWGYDCGIEEEWFLEFGWRALLRYWQDTKPKIQEPKPNVLESKAKAPPATEQPRRITVNADEHARSLAIAGLQSDAPPLPRPPAMPPPVPQIGTQASEVVFALKRKAWRYTLQTLEWERDAQMTSPEARLENKFWTGTGRGFFGTDFAEKPEWMRPKPPQPPKGLPPIAEDALGRVRTRKEYESVVRIGLDVDFKYGITALVPEKTRTNWVKEAFDHLKPHIDVYWREYSAYLQEQGWVEVKTKKALSLHCEWLVRFVVLGQQLSRIAENVRTGGINNQAISAATRDVAPLVGVTWKERRGRKSS